jgi:hypothetical protein
MSGYAEPMLGKSGVLDASILLLEKPFTEPTLLAKVREAFAAALPETPASMPQPST